MKGEIITMKVTKEFKERLKRGCDYYCENYTRLVIRAINEFLDRVGIK